MAEQAREELVRQVEQGRAPRTNATVSLLLEEHLAKADLGRRTRQSLQGYARKHVHPLRIGACTIGEVGVQLLETFYAELRRCRDHCDGRTEIRHYTTGEHRCGRRCRPHVCRGLGDATIRKIHFLLSAAWETAIRWQWVASNPTTGGQGSTSAEAASSAADRGSGRRAGHRVLAVVCRPRLLCVAGDDHRRPTRGAVRAAVG